MDKYLIQRVQPIDRLPQSKHSTQDPNERRRRQIVLTHGYSTSKPNSDGKSFSSVLRDTFELSKEGKAALKEQQKGDV